MSLRHLLALFVVKQHQPKVRGPCPMQGEKCVLR
jgi:hypothetical protein